MTYDPIRLEIFKHLFASVAEEMGTVLRKSSYSPNIKERRDYSCAVFDAQAQMIAQAAHIPVHLGSMPLSVKAAIQQFSTDLGPGDAVTLNDPFRGGTHLPDITIVSPVFIQEDREALLVGFVASRAHHADVGGMTPGSMPVGRELFQEGLIIPASQAGTRREDGSSHPRPDFGKCAHTGGAPGRFAGSTGSQPARNRSITGDGQPLWIR